MQNGSMDGGPGPGGVPVSQMGGMMPMGRGPMGQMGNGPMGGQNMNLLNKPNGAMMGGPVSSGDMNMTSMNSSMPMSSMPQGSMGHPSQMTMAPMSSMGGTMVSSGGGGMMQTPGGMQNVRPMMGQQTIINTGQMNGPMVRHLGQIQGAVMRQGGPGGMMGPGTRIMGPVRIQNIVSILLFCY